MRNAPNNKTGKDKVILFRILLGFVDILSESIFRRIRIKQRLLVMFILLSILPLIIIGLVSIQLSTKAIEENISNYSIQLLTQVAHNITNETKKLEDLSMEFMVSYEMRVFDDSIREKNEFNRLNALKQMETFFENKLSGYEDIASIAFYPYEYDILAKTEVLINRSNNDKKSIFEGIINTNGSPVWIYMKNRENDFGVDTTYEFSGHDSLRVQTPVLFRKISSMYDAKVLGVVHIAPKKEVLQKICSNVDIGKEGKVLLLDSGNKVISAQHPQLLDNVIYDEIDKKLKVQSNNNGYFFADLSGTRMLVCYSVLEETGWKVLSMIPFENLTKRINQITIFVIMLMAICILVALLISYMVTRSVCLPINRINETAEFLGKGDFSKKLDIKYKDEMTSFSREFNKMSDDMQNLISEVYLTKIQKVDSDFKALQAQINPHFLYNTLESINSLALIKKEWEISEMIRGLASVFRYSIKKDENSITLKDELEHVRLYILLQALRYEDKIKIEFKIDEDLLHVGVIKFLLQPLVENAIIHGIEKMNRKGLIQIEAYRNEDQLIIVVSDNGKGMDADKLGEFNKRLESIKRGTDELRQGSDSIGLINIHSRIRLYFGEKYGLSIESAIDIGTSIFINLPFTE